MVAKVIREAQRKMKLCRVGGYLIPFGAKFLAPVEQFVTGALLQHESGRELRLHIICIEKLCVRWRVSIQGREHPRRDTPDGVNRDDLTDLSSGSSERERDSDTSSMHKSTGLRECGTARDGGERSRKGIREWTGDDGGEEERQRI